MTTVKEKTLLDEFAMAALNGVLQNESMISNIVCALPLRYTTIEEDIVNFAYKIATEMMKERQKYDNYTQQKSQLSMSEIAELVQES